MRHFLLFVVLILRAPALAQPQVDHIILAVPDLERAAAEIAALTGVTPVFGGAHTGRGTGNYLLALGPRTYLEILGPYGEAGSDGFAAHLTRLPGPTLMGFAVSGAPLEKVKQALADAQINTSEITPGSREKPDGTVLRWRAMGADAPQLGVQMPFFIDWGDSAHPATTSPSGARLTRLTVGHPAHEPLQAAITASGEPATVVKSLTPILVAELETPNGPVMLTGTTGVPVFSDD
ncbi:MAG: VOC family protein [Rhodothalassiaceae bacterium]